MKEYSSPRGRRSYCVLLMMLLLLLLPLALQAQAPPAPESGILVPNPATDLWRAVRQREGSAAPASTQVRGTDSAVLINPEGEEWRDFRKEQLLPSAGWLLIGALGLVTLFGLIRGKIRIESGPSDKKLFRYSLYERSVHWIMAGSFVLLALTGIVIMFGRTILLPLLGPEAFGALAGAGKFLHNWLGPVFGIAMLLMFFKFVRRNIYAPGDLTWLLKGGGVVGKAHVPSGFFNMGEKSMFWMVVLVGGLIAASGILLLFPWLFGLDRADMTLSHLAHGIAAVVMSAVILGHIYIGSIGMEGAIEGMKTGYCDLNWAKEHHDKWASEVEDKAVPKE